VLFEFFAVGNSVKVCAIDSVAMVEAVILGLPVPTRQC
jgi:hypothetical protein